MELCGVGQPTALLTLRIPFQEVFDPQLFSTEAIRCLREQGRMNGEQPTVATVSVDKRLVLIMLPDKPSFYIQGAGKPSPGTNNEEAILSMAFDKPIPPPPK